MFNKIQLWKWINENNGKSRRLANIGKIGKHIKRESTIQRMYPQKICIPKLSKELARMPIPKQLGDDEKDRRQINYKEIKITLTKCHVYNNI